MKTIPHSYTQSTVTKGTKLQCIVVITVGLVCQKGKEWMELVCWVLWLGDVMITNKGVLLEQILGLIFLVYRYHEPHNHAFLHNWK